MEKIILGILILICAVIFWQDMRLRTVHWILFPLLFLSSISVKWGMTSFENWMYNLFLIIFLLGSLTLYLTFRKGTLVNITKGFFSWGDILFLLAVIPLFETFSYIVFFTIGTIVVLLLHVLAHIYKPQTTIPYAGYMGLFTIGYLFMESQLIDLISIQR